MLTIFLHIFNMASLRPHFSHQFYVLTSFSEHDQSIRTLLLLKSGSSHNFDTLWNSNIAINDPYGNYSLIQDGKKLAGLSDFKIDINSSWGDIQTVSETCKELYM